LTLPPETAIRRGSMEQTFSPNLLPFSGTNPGALESENGHQKQVFIKDLKPKDIVRSTFLVKSKDLGVSRNGKPFLSLILSDKTGEMDTRVFDEAESLSSLFQEGDIIAVSGKATSFQNRMQLVIQHLVPVPAAEIDLTDYLPKTRENLPGLYRELLGYFEGLDNIWVRELGLKLLGNPEIASRYQICPAAKTIHHAFIGGLLTHSVQLIRIVDSILPLYEKIDRNLLVFGAAFHDFGKIYELSYGSSFGYTDEGKLVGHIAIGVSLIDREIQKMPGFPSALEWQLKHLILSHHGRLDYGSPKRPATLEAIVLHSIDDMDSKINSIQTLMNSENNDSNWTSYHRAYDQYYYKPSASDSLLKPD